MAEENQMTLDQYFEGKTPIKLGSPLRPFGSFPLAKASDIIVEYDDNAEEGKKEKRLPEKLKELEDKQTGVQIDPTFQKEGYAADAKNTGDQINSLGDKVTLLQDEVDHLSESLGGGIVDVEQLPTENINENVIYRLVRYNGIFVVYNNKTVAIEDYLGEKYINITVVTEYIDTLPRFPMASSFQHNGFVYLYVLKSTGIAFCQVNNNNITIGQQIYEEDGYDKGLAIDTIDKPKGIYCVITPKYYAYKLGFWTEFAKVGYNGVQIVETEEEMNKIIDNATGKNEDEYYQYMGPTGPVFRHGGIYKVTQEVKD